MYFHFRRVLFLSIVMLSKLPVFSVNFHFNVCFRLSSLSVHFIILFQFLHYLSAHFHFPFSRWFRFPFSRWFHFLCLKKTLVLLTERILRRRLIERSALIIATLFDSSVCVKAEQALKWYSSTRSMVPLTNSFSKVPQSSTRLISVPSTSRHSGTSS